MAITWRADDIVNDNALRTGNYDLYALHYGIRADIFKKSYQEMFNFESWIFCQFSSNTWIFGTAGALVVITV